MEPGPVSPPVTVLMAERMSAGLSRAVRWGTVREGPWAKALSAVTPETAMAATGAFWAVVWAAPVGSASQRRCPAKLMTSAMAWAVLVSAGGTIRAPAPSRSVRVERAAATAASSAGVGARP